MARSTQTFDGFLLTMTQLNTIAFRVVPSPDTNDHEVKIFVDGRDFITQHWPDMMGMDPDDVLSYRELLPRDESLEATVVRCGCGVVGCGSVWVRISTNDDRVIWDAWQRDKGNPPAGTLVFSRGQYTQALKDAVEDHSWETPTELQRAFSAHLLTMRRWRLTISNISGLPVASKTRLYRFLLRFSRATIK